MMVRSISLLALGLFLAGGAQAETPDPTPTLAGSFLASRSAAKAHDLEATAHYTAEALKFDPNNGILIERLFQTFVMQGDETKAEDVAQRVIKLNSQHRMARTVLGLKEFRARRFPEARAQFQEASYTPLGTLTSTLLNAWSYAGEGSLNAALKELDKLDGQDAFANYKSLHTGLIADLLGSAIRAEAAYKKAYDAAPTSLRVVQAYGNWLERSGRKEEAEKVYRRFLADGQRDILVQQALRNLQDGKKPETFVSTPQAGASEVLFSIASALIGDQNSENALVYAQLALSVQGDKPIALATLGGIQSDLGLYEQSNSSFAKVAEDSALWPFVQTQIAINLQRLEKKEEALSGLQKVAAKFPNDYDTNVTMAALLRADDKYAEAADAYSKAIDLLGPGQSSDWRIYYDRGITYDKLKQYDKSEADFRKALQISNNEPSVLNYLGYSLIDRGEKLDEALAMVKKAVEIKANDGFIVDSLAWAYYKLRDYDQAVTYSERAVDLTPGDPTISDHLGDIYWAAGRKLEAKFQWQHAIDNKPDPEDLVHIQDKLKNGLPDALPSTSSDGSAPEKPADAPVDAGAAKPTNG